MDCETFAVLTVLGHEDGSVLAAYLLLTQTAFTNFLKLCAVAA